MKKLFLLFQNHYVKKAKLTLQSVIDKYKGSKLEYVLLPIPGTGCTYLPIQFEALQTLDFASAMFRYHMTLSMTSRRYAHDDVVEPKYDYFTTRLIATSLEEFYYALHNIMAFRYMKALSHSSEEDSYWFIDIADLDIEIVDRLGNSVGRELIQQSVLDDTVPFHIAALDDICKICAAKYGIGLDCEMTDAVFTGHFCLNDDGDVRTWVYQKRPIELFSRVSVVGVINLYTGAISLIRDDDYDAALRIGESSLYLTPISLGLGAEHVTSHLRQISAYYGLDKYSFIRSNDADDEYQENRVFHDWADCILDCFTYVFYDIDDVLNALEYLPWVFQVYREAATHHLYTTVINEDEITSEDQEALMLKKYRDQVTVLADFRITISTSSSAPTEDDMLKIVTDSYQDYLPNAKEVSYLLKIQELGTD